MAHTITEDEKSGGLLFAGWTPRKADGIIESESEGLRTRGAYGVNPSLRAGEDEMSSHIEAGKKGANSSFLCLLFYSGLNGLEDAHPCWGGPSALLASSVQMLISFRNTLADTPRNNV